MLLNKLLSAPFAAQPLVFVGGSAQRISSSSTPVYSLTSLGGGIATSPSAGDIVIAAVTFANGTDRNITCTGYTELADLYATSTGNSQLGVYYKVLSSSDTSVTFSIGTLTNSCCAIHVWRNQNIIQPDVSTTTFVSTTSGDADSPSITTVTNGSIVIAVGAAEGNAVNNLTAPTGMTNSVFSTDSAGAFGIGMASILRASAGAYDPPSFGGGAAPTGTSCAVTLAIRPL